jgi:hypothetical protein
VLVFMAVNLLVTWVFGASVSAQGGAYATGVMVLMTSACLAVVLDLFRRQAVDRELATSGPTLPRRPRGRVVAPLVDILRRVPWFYVLITLVFLYTTVAIVIEKPDGIKIAGAFIAAVIVFSMVSRTRRSTELRFERFEFVDESSRLLWDTLRFLEFPVLVPHRPGSHSIADKEAGIRRVHRLDAKVPVVFIQTTLGDTSEFAQTPLMEITASDGRFVVRLTRCVSVAHAIATIALELSKVGKPPELHFGWSDESPLAANLNFVLFGEGNVPWLVRELLQKGQADPTQRPRVIIG